jgi:hypothetical protein
MDGKLIGPCSLTKLMFTDEENCAQESIINFPERLVSVILEYKIELFDLQMTFLEGKLNNLKEISRCFKKLEKEFDKLLSE